MRRSLQRGLVVGPCALVAALACTSAPSDHAGGSTSAGGNLGSGAASTSGGGSGASGVAGGSAVGGSSSPGGTCAAPSTPCAGQCTDVSSDPANCGACGTVCSASQVCSQGVCGSSCAAGLTKCGAACVDITGSQANCGSCGHACPSDQTCWQSECICPMGQDACGDGGACIDVQQNPSHCGKCNEVCAEGATCSAGQCACPGLEIACDGACVDASSDESNCGECGETCGPGTSCLSGACLDPSTLSCSGSQQGYSCTKGASVVLGPYWVNNNWWGADGASGQTCIWGNCATGDLAGWGQSFDWTGGSAGQVKTFSSIVFGWHWGWRTGGGGQRLVTALPLQLTTDKAVNCGWSFDVTQSGTITINVAYDLFVHALSNPGSTDDPTDEIMIWLYRASGAAPLGTKQDGTLSAGGGTYDLYSGDNGYWNVHSYVRQANATTAVLDMMAFMDDLASRNLVASSKYLSSIQAGAEIFSGEGQVQTNGFYCRVQ